MLDFLNNYIEYNNKCEYQRERLLSFIEIYDLNRK